MSVSVVLKHLLTIIKINYVMRDLLWHSMNFLNKRLVRTIFVRPFLFWNVYEKLSGEQKWVCDSWLLAYICMRCFTNMIRLPKDFRSVKGAFKNAINNPWQMFPEAVKSPKWTAVSWLDRYWTLRTVIASTRGNLGKTNQFHKVPKFSQDRHLTIMIF